MLKVNSKCYRSIISEESHDEDTRRWRRCHHSKLLTIVDNLHIIYYCYLICNYKKQISSVHHAFPPAHRSPTRLQHSPAFKKVLGLHYFSHPFMAKRTFCPAQAGSKSSWPVRVRPQPLHITSNTNLVDRKGNKATLIMRLEQRDNAKTVYAITTHSVMGGARNVSSVTPGIPQAVQPLAPNKSKGAFLSTQLPDLSQLDAEPPIQIVRIISSSHC